MRHYLPAGLVTPNDPVPVILVGAGGTGSRLLSGLAQLHFALRALEQPGLEVHVIDGDTVSTANVGRQLFSPSDVGRNKAEVLTTRVNMFYGLAWKAYPQMLSNDMKFRSRLIGEYRHVTALLVTAVDSAAARAKALKTYMGKVDYWLDTGNTMDTGQVVFGTVGKDGVEQPKRAKHTVPRLPHVLDLYPDMAAHDKSAKQGPSCSVAEALERQDLFINQWVASAALAILWKGFRKGHLKEHGAFINLKTLSTRPLAVDPTVWKRMGWREDKPKKERKKNA
jgi:PRTRC genetic system ThiF family protein